MPFAVEVLPEAVREWTVAGDAVGAGATCETVTDYHPTVYVQAADGPLGEIAAFLENHPRVADTAVEEHRPGFRAAPEPVVRADVDCVQHVRSVAWAVRDRGGPGAYRPHGVDLSPGFRYCLDRERSPVPEGALTPLSLSCSPLELREAPIGELTIGRPVEDAPARGESARDETAAAAGHSLAETTVDGGPAAVLDALAAALDSVDPDVLFVDAAALVPRLFETADALGREEFALGRLPGYRELAGESTYESYGRVGHSPARYSVPGRAIVDRSNTFVYHEANLAGCLDLVERSRRPLQELGWASIGTILTAIQIREARDRGVLVPWRSWRHEFTKPMATLSDADRGGYTFAPDVGVHADVHELDFASLYPNIIRTRNVSPEVIRCACHDRADVPGLGYSICEEEGYLPGVLGPLIDDRAAYKERLAATDDPAERAALRGRSDAIKWILVSCFGYQGFANAKFGRIECHEAINAFAREILLDAKETLEANGWRVVHGIVDSLWVTARPGAAQTPLEEVAATITDDADIALEYEGAFDWIAFCPMRDSEAGALTKYVGARAGAAGPERGDGTADGDGGGSAGAAGGTAAARRDGDAAPDPDAYKYRGVECRQRSTTTFVAGAQRDLIAALDRALTGERGRDPAGTGDGDPAAGPTTAAAPAWTGPLRGPAADRAAAAVCDRLRDHLADLRAGRVDPADLAVRNRTSKPAAAYSQYTRGVAALERAADVDLAVHPGQDVEYVVVDDGKSSRDRVALVCEAPATYDPDFYADRLVRAATSVVAPLGWREDDVRTYLAEHRDATLAAFGD